MPIQTKRTIMSTEEAARIIGVTQGRVRQLVLEGKNGEKPKLWSKHLGKKILVVDSKEVHKYAKQMAALRSQGKVRGAKPGGYKRDKPGEYKKGK